MVIHMENGEVHMRKLIRNHNTTKPHIPSLCVIKKKTHVLNQIYVVLWFCGLRQGDKG